MAIHNEALADERMTRSDQFLQGDGLDDFFMAGLALPRGLAAACPLLLVLACAILSLI